jgi:hypothetical protein
MRIIHLWPLAAGRGLESLPRNYENAIDSVVSQRLVRGMCRQLQTIAENLVRLRAIGGNYVGEQDYVGRLVGQQGRALGRLHYRL